MASRLLHGSPESQPAQTVAETLPADLPGLNVRAGLASVGGRVDTYCRLLRMLADRHADDMTRIRAALAAGQLDEVTRIAHSLKGAAATLGAESVRGAAREIETAARSGASAAEITYGIERLETVLNELLTVLGAFLEDATAGGGGVGSAPADAQDSALLSQLLAYLEVDNLLANTLWREHAGRFAQLLGPVAQEVGRAIEGYDFARGLRLLRAVSSDPPCLR